MARLDDLRVLPKVRDSGSFLYLEYGRLEQDSESVRFVSEIGRTAIPVANLSLLLLGPGTTVTQRAIVNAVDCGCTVAWSGQDGVRLYATGLGDTRSSRYLLKQAVAYADEQLRMKIVRAMYEFRFGERIPEDLTLRQIRGKEGARVRETYRAWSRSTGIEWNRRAYRAEEWEHADPINRALSAANSCLYGICHAAVVSAGFSPGIGFVHTGKALSFVYDVADLYKMEVAVPAAFKAVRAGQPDVERVVRLTLREQFHEFGLLRRIVTDVIALFEFVEAGERQDEAADADGTMLFDAAFDSKGFTPGDLWDPDGDKAGGASYADDMSAEGDRAD